MSRESAAPVGAGEPDPVADVVVVGGGGGGLPAALFARWLGDEVILLEKADELGGTARKAAYNDLAQTFFQWDPLRGEYPYLVLVQVWDQRSQEHSASDEYGRLIVGDTGASDAHVLRGETLAELGQAVRERLAVTGGLTLADDWADTLDASIARFNELAATGVDDDFGRGERAVQQLFNGDVKEEPGRTNPTLWPLADSGPYYAALGPIIAFAYRAANAAHIEPAREEEHAWQ